MSQDTIIRRGDMFVTAQVHEVHLAQAYMQMFKEGTLGVVFHQHIPTLREFLNEFLAVGNRIVCGCFRDIPGGKPLLCGLAWAFGTTGMGEFKRCEVGEWFSKEAMRKSERNGSLQFSQMALSIFFDISKIDVVFGVTPTPNRLAVKFARAMGFDLIGPIPDYCVWNGKLCAAWISHLSRAQWNQRYGSKYL